MTRLLVVLLLGGCNVIAPGMDSLKDRADKLEDRVRKLEYIAVDHGLVIDSIDDLLRLKYRVYNLEQSLKKERCR